MIIRLLRRSGCFAIGHTWQPDLYSGAGTSFAGSSPMRKVCEECGVRRLGDVYDRGLPGSVWIAPLIMLGSAGYSVFIAETMHARIAWVVTLIYALFISVGVPLVVRFMNHMARDARRARAREALIRNLLEAERQRRSGTSRPGALR